MIMTKQESEKLLKSVMKRSGRVILCATVILSLLLLLTLSAGCSSFKEMVYTTGVGTAVGSTASLVTGTFPAVALGSVAAGVTAGVISDSSNNVPSNPENASSPWGAIAVLFATSAKWIGVCALAFIVLGWLMPSPFKLNKSEKNKNS